MSSKLRDMAEKLQQAPNVSEQMAKLEQMLAVGYDDYWKGRQPAKSPFADFRGLSTPQAQGAAAQVAPDLGQPLLEAATPEKTPENTAAGRSGNNPLEVAKALGKGVANFDEGNEQFTAGMGILWADFWQDRLGKKITDMVARDELTPEKYRQIKYAQRTPESALWGENGLTIVADDDPRAKTARRGRNQGIITQSEAKRIDEARNADMVFNRDLRARWAKFVEAAERGEIRLSGADKNGRSTDPQKLYADFKRYESGNYEGVPGYRPKAGEMKPGDNEWAQEVGYNRRNERLSGWHEDAESRKNKNTYERGTAAYYAMMVGESAPDIALTFGSTGLARGILKGAVKKAAIREGVGAAARETAEQTARAAGKTAAEVAAAGRAAEKMAVKTAATGRMAAGKLAEAGAGAGTGFVSARVGFDAYASARTQGLPPEQAATYATWYALAEAIPERIAIGKILRGNGTVKKQVLRGMFAEGVQESVTQVLQNTADIQMLDRKMSLKDFLLDTLDAAVVGSVMGGTVGGIHAGIQKAGEAEQVNYRKEWEELVGAAVDGQQGGGMGAGITPDGKPAPDSPARADGAPPASPNPAPQEQQAAPPQAGFGTVAAENGAPDVASDELQEDLNELTGAAPPAWFDGKNWFSPAEIAAIAQTDLEAALRISSAQRVMANPDITDEQKRDSGVANIDSPAQVLEAMRAALGDNITGQEESAAADNVTAEPAAAQQPAAAEQPPQNPAPPAPPPQNPAPANPAPNTPPAEPAPVGGNSSTIRANGQEHGVTFEVREAASLSPATEAGTVNQARNRASNAQSAAQVANIAANLDPVTLTADTHEMDTGMPTLARDGQTIIAGNGRTMAVQQAYAQHPERAQAYRQHLIDNAAAYGLDPAAVAQMQNPVLVRRFTDNVDVQQMATASNAGTGMSLSAYELAATDAQALPADLRNLVGGTDGMIDPTTGTNAAVMGQWAQSLPENRRNAVYTQDGRTLSREGLLAFRNAVLYRAYGEGVDMGDGITSRQTLADIIENNVEELRNVRNALVNIAPRVVDMKARVQQGLYPAELDISADFLRASESLTQTRKANGPTVESIINQQNLDGSSYPANAATILRYFNARIRSGADIRSYLNGYYDWANAQQSTNTADIFGAAPPTAAQGLAEAARAVDEGRQLGAVGQANIHYSTPPQAGGFGVSIPASWPQDEHAEFAHPSLYGQYRQQAGEDIVARLAHLQNLSTNPALPDGMRVDALREQTAILNYIHNGGTRPDIPADPYAPPRKAPPPASQATPQEATRDGTQHGNDSAALPPPRQRALPPGSQALPPAPEAVQEAAASEQTAAPDYAEVRRLLERVLGKQLAEKVTLSNTLPNGQPMPQEGAYLADGTLIINPDAIRAFEVDGVTVLTREQRIAWVAWHEFVHRGAAYYRQVWGGKEWQMTLNKLRQNSALRHLAEAIQAERNAAWLNSGQDVRVTAEQAMEEALAELAAAIEQGNAAALIERYGRYAPTTGRTKLQALLGKMADVIRRVLGRITKRQITETELSDADAIGLLRDITALQGADNLADARASAGLAEQRTPPANPERFYNEETARGIPREQDRDTGGSRLTGGEDSIGADGLNINLPDNGTDVRHSTAPDTSRRHTAATDLETVTDTLLTNARSVGSRADTHSVDTIDDSTPQSTAAQEERYSTTPSPDEAEDSAFARAVDDVVAGKVSAGYISLGTTPEVLKLIGVPDGKVRISGGTIEKAMAGYLNRNNSHDGNRHAIRPEDMKQLPAHLNDPIAVFKSATRADSFVVLTELMERENGRDKPVIAALHLQKGKRGLNLVDIASVYGRSDGQLVRAFDTDLLYLDKQKGRQFLTTHPLQLHWDITSDADLSVRNIKTNEDLTQEADGAQTADNGGEVRYSTDPQQEFEATAQQYGGQAAYKQAKAAGETELDYRQWVQVRTPSFKAWFGDWQNDPKNASKVVHPKTGEPLVVYHGTVLPLDKVTPNTGWQKDGSYIRQEAPFSIFRGGSYRGLIFTSPKQHVARTIAENRSVEDVHTEEGYVFPLFLNARKPFDIESGEQVDLALNKMKEEISVLDYYGGEAGTIARTEAKRVAQGRNSWLLAESDNFQDFYREQGFDAVMARDNGDKYIAVFDPNQIKSATGNSGAYNPADANIYHSTAPETGDQTPDGKQQQTLRVARVRILNIARAIWDGAKNIGGEGIDFGTTPPVYQALGADALPLRIVDTRKLFSLLRPKSEQGQRGDNTHELTPELLAQIPEALQKPVMVFDTEQGGGFVAVTELTDSDGAPVVVAIHLNHKMRYYQVNKVASIYGKNNAERAFAKWTKEGRLRYVDTTSPPLLTSNGVQYTHEKSARDYGYTVLTEADIVKLQQQLTQTEAETRTGQALLGTGQDGEQYSIPPQLVTDPPTQAGLGKRIWQAFTDPTVRDLWFDRQGELERILKADPNAEKVRNAFKMYNAKTQNTLEGAPQQAVRDLGKALAAHYKEAKKRVPALQNMKAKEKVREQMFMEWLDGIGKYVYHGRERNAVILQRSKGKQTDGSGTDEAGIQEAERFFNSAEMGGGVLLAIYEDLYKNHLQPMMQMSDDYLRDAGLLTPQMEAARPDYRWYVPLYGAPQLEDSTIEKIVRDAAAAQRPNNGGASRTDAIRNRTHNAEGRHGTEAENLFANIIAQMETAVRRAALQEPKRRLWAYLQTAEGARLFAATTSSYTINGANRNTKGGRSWQKHTPDADEVVWQDGDTIHRMHIGNLRALEAIRDFNRQAIKYGANPLTDAGSWGLEQAGRITRFMAGMYTRYNPSFVLRNKAMDSIQQWITLLADAPVGKETRAGLAGYADAIGNIASRLPVAAKAAAYNAAWTASGVWGRQGTDFAPWLERLARQGGVTTYSQYFGRDKRQGLQDIMWAETQGAKKWANLKHDFSALESMMTAINDHMELTTRVSAFRALVESGVSEEAAAVWVKDVMNFETKGDAGIKANMLFPFFTTSLYDARRTFKALSRKEG